MQRKLQSRWVCNSEFHRDAKNAETPQVFGVFCVKDKLSARISVSFKEIGYKKEPGDFENLSQFLPGSFDASK